MAVHSLDLDDDDASQALSDLERSLGFRFQAAELTACRTVGDIFRIVARHLDGTGGEACASAIAFYRLRRALSPYAGGEKLRPSSVLATVVPIPPKRLLIRIEAETRLHLPPPTNSWLGRSAFAVAMLAFLGMIPVHMLYPGWTLLTILLIPVAIWTFANDPGRYARDCRTLGNLAKQTALLNFGPLLEAGARPRPGDQWEVLTEILSGYGTVPKAAITPDMLILPAERYAA
jgi:hypothetical protein